MVCANSDDAESELEVAASGVALAESLQAPELRADYTARAADGALASPSRRAIPVGPVSVAALGENQSSADRASGGSCSGKPATRACRGRPPVPSGGSTDSRSWRALLRRECLQAGCKHSVLNLATSGFLPGWRPRPLLAETRAATAACRIGAIPMQRHGVAPESSGSPGVRCRAWNWADRDRPPIRLPAPAICAGGRDRIRVIAVVRPRLF